MTLEHHLERQLAGAVADNIRRTTPKFHWAHRKPFASYVAGAVAVLFAMVVVLGLVAVAMSKRADAHAVYPLDSKAVHP